MPEPKSVREILGQAVGQASLCWKETPKGMFDSTSASKIVKEALSAIRELLHREMPNKQEHSINCEDYDIRCSCGIKYFNQCSDQCHSAIDRVIGKE